MASLITLLEAGSTPWRRAWDATSPGHHVNLISGRRYRGANPVLLTLGQHLRASAFPYWCGFAEARSLGLVPRRGSRAVHVLRPLVQQSRAEPVGQADGVAAGSATASGPGSGSSSSSGVSAAGSAAAGAGRPGVPAVSAAGAPTAAAPADGPHAAPAAARTWVSYRPVPLFNAADLQGEALQGLIRRRRQAEAASRRPEPERLAAAEAVLGSWPVPVCFGGDRACYLPERDLIRLPERSAFHDAAALYATWAHEAIHSTGHGSRLARDLSGGMGDGGDGGTAYAREELVAELGAVLLGDRLEIGSPMANHAAYLGHWLEFLRESPRRLLQVLSDARRAADLILPEGADPPAPGA